MSDDVVDHDPSWSPHLLNPDDNRIEATTCDHDELALTPMGAAAP